MRAAGVAESTCGGFGEVRRLRASVVRGASGQAVASRGRVTVDCDLLGRIAYQPEDGRVAHLRSRPATVLTWGDTE